MSRTSNWKFAFYWNNFNWQKVFDTIDHEILLMKMKYLGFSSNVIAKVVILSQWTKI